MAEPYVIIGNGVAGVNAAEAIRERYPNGEIIILSDQECEFYSRPALYYVLLGRIEFEDTAGRLKTFNRDNNFDLRCAVKAIEIDPAEHKVVLEDGEVIGYSKLCVAMGTVPRILPWANLETKGVLTLNTLTDIVEISHMLGRAEEAVVVGGGLTSVELVESLVYNGIETTFIMRDDHFLARQLTSEEADLVHEKMRKAGVRLRFEDEVTEMSVKAGAVESVATEKGAKIPCQIAGLAVGIVADRELPQRAGLEVEKGVIVDEKMQTNAPDIWAAGDCAQVRREGRVMPGELLWYVAANMGRTAGANMAGGDETYIHEPFLNCAEFYGTDFCGVGQIDPAQEGVREMVSGKTGQGTARLVLKEDVIVGACFVGDIRLGDISRGLISQGARWSQLPGNHPLRARFE